MIEITLYTDPACPFAFSAEPARWRLHWHYGDGLAWRTRMIVLTLEPGESERLAEGAPNLQRIHGMPIRPFPYARTFSSEPACRAFVAARVHAPARAEALLRRLRIRTMAGGLLDDPELIAAAAADAGLDPQELERWCAGGDVEAELAADVEAARTPTPAARALDHKLGGPRSRRRYTAPSYELSGPGDRTSSLPGFHAVEAYEAAVASLEPELPRRARPSSAEELLRWAGEPLATAEVALVLGLDQRDTRAELADVARAIPSGADFFWTLD